MDDGDSRFDGGDGTEEYTGGAGGAGDPPAGSAAEDADDGSGMVVEVEEGDADSADLLPDGGRPDEGAEESADGVLEDAFGDDDGDDAEDEDDEDEEPDQESIDAAMAEGSVGGGDDDGGPPADRKESYGEASGKVPGKLRKKTILNTLVVIALVTFLGTLFMPESCGQKKSAGRKNGQASEVSLSDFRSQSTGRFDGDGGARAKRGGHAQDGDGAPEAPPDDQAPPGADGGVRTEDAPPQAAPQAAYAGGGAAAAEERPDTRRDTLQTAVSGIKGLSASRSNYATDYEATKERNAADAASGSNIYSTYGLPDRSEAVNTILAMAKAQQAGGQPSWAAQNDQTGKQDFHRAGGGAGGGEWLDRNSLWQGTVFEAELTTALNTDLPGEITARVTKNVYSSQTGEYLLIPQNSILYGTYNSSVSYSQKRAQIAWNKIIRPDGYAINLGNFNAVDRHGAAGVRGIVNDHPMAYLKAIALMSVFNIINGEFQSSMDGTDNEYVENVMANSQEVATELGEKLIDRAMDVQPTITKPAGTIVYVLTNQNLTLPPVEMPPVTVPYQRRRGWQK